MTQPVGLTLAQFADEMRPFFNDICIVFDCTLARLVGVCATEEDMYYVMRELGKGRHLYSAVGRCVSLRGHYPDADYAHLDVVFTGNNAGPAEDFIIEDRRFERRPAFNRG